MQAYNLELSIIFIIIFIVIRKLLISSVKNKILLTNIEVKFQLNFSALAMSLSVMLIVFIIFEKFII